MKLAKVCEACGRAYLADRRTQRFCSMQCNSGYDNGWRPDTVVALELDGVTVLTRKCRSCGRPIPIPSERRAVCLECSAPLVACARCGTEFRDPHKIRRFCSRACAAAVGRASPKPSQRGVARPHIRGTNSASWRGGSRAYRGPGWHEIRERIRERDDWHCRDCGDDRRGRKLDVHHLVAAEDWATPGSANDDSNLVSLCPRCHSVRHQGVSPRRPTATLTA